MVRDRVAYVPIVDLSWWMGKEEMVDCLWTAFANAMSKGYIHDRSEFMRAFNTGFVDAFWELCQNMQGEEPQENGEGDAAAGDDYELTI